MSFLRGSLLLLFVALSGTSLTEMVFRCPTCTPERQALCPELTEHCVEMVREPGCGCCPVCARQEGELCGVYTPRCSAGLRCYPEPGSDLPLEQLVKGHGLCGHKVEPEPTAWTSAHHSQASEDSAPLGDLGMRPSKEGMWRDTAVRQHRQDNMAKMRTNQLEELVKAPPPKPTQCQQELDQVLERISKMPFRENRGPLEELYALHIPNCTREGQYNIKQCKMSLHGQRGECWCVNPHTGRTVPSGPTVRGDPNCNQYLGGPELDPPYLASDIV